MYVTEVKRHKMRCGSVFFHFIFQSDGTHVGHVNRRRVYGRRVPARSTIRDSASKDTSGSDSLVRAAATVNVRGGVPCFGV